jgi:hypothetical protein
LVKLVGDFGNHSESLTNCTAEQRIERCTYATHHTLGLGALVYARP